MSVERLLSRLEDPIAVQTPDAERKRFETLRAKLARKGFELLATDHGTFIVHKWNLTRQCREFAEVEAFAVQAGA